MTIPQQFAGYGIGIGTKPNAGNVPVIQSRAPASTDTNYFLGTFWIDQSANNTYQLTSFSSSGGVLSATWVQNGSSTGAIFAVNGTSNQVTASTSSGTVTLSTPSSFIAPGSIASTTTLTGGTGITATTGNITATAGAVSAGTTVTATLGAITATNGNLVLNTAGNKIVIATGTNASVGTSDAMTAGAVTVATTACSATAKVFYARATVGGTPGNVSITAQDGTGFTLTSSSNTETSTFNWWVINA